MTNRPRQIGECYTKFGLKHTSKSQILLLFYGKPLLYIAQTLASHPTLFSNLLVILLVQKDYFALSHSK